MAMEGTRRHDMGEGGWCVCPKCGRRTAHRRGVPCQEDPCPACGAKMLREGSHHHELWTRKQAEKDKSG